MDATLLKAMLTLGAVVAALAVVLALVRRYTAGQLAARSGTQFRVIGQLALQPKKQVYLLLVADRLLVVGVADQGMTTLAEISDPEVVAALVESRLPAGTSRFPFDRHRNRKADSPLHDPVPQRRDGILSFSEFLKALGKKEAFLRDLL